MFGPDFCFASWVYKKGRSIVRKEMLSPLAGLPRRAVLIPLLLHQRQTGIPNTGTAFHNAC